MSTLISFTRVFFCFVSKIFSVILWLLRLITLCAPCSGHGSPYPSVRYRGPPHSHPPPPHHASPTYIIHRSPTMNHHLVPVAPAPYYGPQRPMYPPPQPPQPYPPIPHEQPSYDKPVVIRMRRKRPVIIMEEADDSGERA